MKKKSFGQHFLHDAGIIKKITDAVEPMDLNVVEIGPGEGALTDVLVQKVKPGKLTLIEADRDLIPFLKEKYPDVKIIEGDAVKVKLAPKEDWILVSNLPYNAAAAILKNALTSSKPPTKLVVMVQKEQADRMRAAAGEMSLLSVFVQLYTTPKKLFDVGKGAFQPPPNVDSTVLKLTYNGSDTIENEEILKIAKAGFSSRRKQLHKNLSSAGIQESDSTKKHLESMGLSVTVRAQELTIDEWRQLAKNLVN